MKASEAIIKCLERENIDLVFGYPGGAVVPLYEALRTSSIKHVLVRHEQSAVHAASGYSRSKKVTGVCMATSGPGATNLITGIATAYMDSIPLVIITGQVNSDLIGKDVFQEADIVGATAPFTKHNYLVNKAEDIPRIFKEAFHIASTGRPGPVLIDIPRDIQEDTIDFKYPEKVNILGYKPTLIGHKGQIKKIVSLINKSTKPLICVGGGIHCSDAIVEFREFCNKSSIPVVHTLMGIGAIDSKSLLNIGMLGSHGQKVANSIVTKSDLIIIIGARIGDRAMANFNLEGDRIDIVHIDIDPAEVGKILSPTIPVVGDARNILNQLNQLIQPLDTSSWLKEIDYISKDHHTESLECNELVNPKVVFNVLSKECESDAIFIADVGKNQIWSARNIEMKNARRFFTSGGLGTMGYSLPAGIGAKLASPNTQVVVILGDGSFQMALPELATLMETGFKITIILFNNNNLGMVRELQDNKIGKGLNHGVDFSHNPNFIKLAKAYGIHGRAISDDFEVHDEIVRALNSDAPYLLEFKVSKDISSII